MRLFNVRHDWAVACELANLVERMAIMHYGVIVGGYEKNFTSC
jgi:hypothetical protein